MAKYDNIDKILWSIAFPGLGQMLNGQIIKGIFFIIIELIVNYYSNLNKCIIYSFVGNIQEAVSNTNYQWLMYYPSLYLYVIWDAYKFSEGEKAPMAFLPYVFAAYFGTIGTVYSASFNVFGIFLGPVWLPLTSIVVGVFIGCFIQKRINNRINLKLNKTK